MSPKIRQNQIVSRPSKQTQHRSAKIKNRRKKKRKRIKDQQIQQFLYFVCVSLVYYYYV